MVKINLVGPRAQAQELLKLRTFLLWKSRDVALPIPVGERNYLYRVYRRMVEDMQDRIDQEVRALVDKP